MLCALDPRSLSARARDERDRGFTLVELLVVVIVVGILAGIALPVYLSQRKKGVDASVRADIRNAASAAEAISVGKPLSGVLFTEAEMTEAGFKKTDGVTVWISGTPREGYCISGYHPDGNANANNRAFWYDSLFGGFRSGGEQGHPAADGACAQSVTNNVGYTWLS